MKLSAVQLFLVLITIILQAALLVVLAQRKFRSRFPFFFNFIVYSTVGLCVRFVASFYLSQAQCSYMRWIFFALSTPFAFLVMHEAFVTLLKPFDALVDFGKLLFRWAGVFLALVSSVTAFAASDSLFNRISTADEVLARSCLLMQSGLLLLFLLFQNRLGLSWRSPAITIMLGFGINASMVLCGSYMREHFASWGVVNWAGPACCIAVYALWGASFALPQPARRTVQDSPMRIILQRWNEALSVTPLGGGNSYAGSMSSIESFLPGVERTVERVMARKMMN